MRENPSSTTPKISFFILFFFKDGAKNSNRQKVIDFHVKKKNVGVSYSSFFVSSFDISLVGCYWLAFELFSSLELQSPLRLITVCFVPNPFAWLWLIFFFCSFNASFYQINPLGIATVSCFHSHRDSTFSPFGFEVPNLMQTPFPSCFLINRLWHMKWDKKIWNGNLSLQIKISHNNANLQITIKNISTSFFPHEVVATEASAPPTTHCQMELTLVYFLHIANGKDVEKNPFSSCNVVITLHANILSLPFFFVVCVFSFSNSHFEFVDKKKIRKRLLENVLL